MTDQVGLKAGLVSADVTDDIKDRIPPKDFMYIGSLALCITHYEPDLLRSQIVKTKFHAKS